MGIITRIQAHSLQISFVAWSKSGGKVYVPLRMALAVLVMVL